MLFNSVKERPMIKPSADWDPKFSPQVTIQHPLEYAIPLSFGLFGFSSQYMPDFSASLPCRDLFLETKKNAVKENFDIFVKSYLQKMNGLVFLHALTLAQMSPVEGSTDIQLLEETYTHLTQFYQIDPKLKLTLMSRRPFSAMFDDIPSNGSYKDYFMSVMCRNSAFFRIPALFNRANYAEQFFNSETGEPKSLEAFLPLFRDNFRTQNEETLTKLLQQGVLSTTMMRNLKEEIPIVKSLSGEVLSGEKLLNNYFEMAVKSVDSPENTYTINPDTHTVQSIPFRYDHLSPPWFLDTENSMGRFKGEMSTEERLYGEAIVEVRGIRNIQSWFFNKCRLDPELTGSFLTHPNESLPEQVLGLFSFLYNFGTPTDITEVFYLGIPSALRSY